MVENIETVVLCANSKSKLIIEICEGYIKNWILFPFNGVEKILTEYNWFSKIIRKIDELNVEKEKINVEYIESLEIKREGAHVLMNTVIDHVTNTGISIGTVFITFSILIILFILYKYTKYFSFLKRRLRILRRALNKYNKNNLDLIGTIDFEYKNSVDDRYIIAYS
ncbi:variable surface protein [Plasmodium gonderi]|uniref:Variable surface protein n=1 Tax=Plasmodium gonderi TaxID=77519 RepID=A0A1Y1JPR7_PLAGO|nr:variable surface protein [Plasmodium gonderi]GAW84471.1 variable surface protein [Plasmodium gonderi]